MKSPQITGYDGEQRIVVADTPVPTPGPDDVLVRVAAAAINPLDVKLARGYLQDFFPLSFPYVLGTDLAGTVHAVGARVTGFVPGDNVLARTETTQGGAFAEWAVVPARLAARVPAGLDLDAAAALPTVGGTDWQALFEIARITSSTRLLVTGGAGSVGGMAVRLAASIGARVHATARERDLDTAKRLGADQVFDARAKLELRDLDLVFDTVGGAGQLGLFALLRDGAMLAAVPSPPDAEAGRARNIDARFVVHASDGSRLAVMASYCAARGLWPAADRVMPLGTGREAVALVASGQARGKILLRP